MKLLMLALAALVFGAASVHADEEDQAITTLQRMVECQAVELSLMQMYNSMAASIDALSPQPPAQLEKLRDSYRMLAETHETEIHAFAEVAKRKLLPQFEPAIQEHYAEELAKSFVVIQRALNLGEYEKQKQMQRQLLSTSQQCETLLHELTDSTT